MGKTVIETVDIESRGALFDYLKSRGIAPTRIISQSHPKPEARNTGKCGYNENSGNDKFRRYALVALTIFVIVAVSITLLSFKNDLGASVQSHKLIKANHRLSRRMDSGASGNSSASLALAAVQSGKVVQEAESGDVDYGIHDNGLSDTAVELLPTPKQPPVLPTPSDELIAMIMSSDGTHELPPMPFGPEMERDFIESLHKPIFINDEDSEEVRRVKETVLAVREQLLELVESGRTVESVLREHQMLVNQNMEIRRDVIQSLQTMLANGNREDAESYLDAVNETLRGAGIPEVEMPMTKDERRAMLEERILQRRASMHE